MISSLSYSSNLRTPSVVLTTDTRPTSNNPSVMNTKATQTASSVSEDALDDDTTYSISDVATPPSTVRPSYATAAGTGSLSYFEQFMPTRPGFSSAALAQAVIDPGTVTLSAGKSLTSAASEARQSLDSNYATMAASGKPFDINSPGGADWYTAFGSLDRTALSAVAGNQEGQFTKQEQGMAQSIMSQQQGLAMGLYGGPSNMQGKFVDTFSGEEPSARFKAAAAWLDKAGKDEKSTVAWAFGRASAQTSYLRSLNPGEQADDLDSDNPLANLITSAMSTMTNSTDRSSTFGNVNNANDLETQPWFAGFQSRLSAAIAETQKLYGR